MWYSSDFSFSNTIHSKHQYVQYIGLWPYTCKTMHSHQAQLYFEFSSNVILLTCLTNIVNMLKVIPVLSISMLECWH